MFKILNPKNKEQWEITDMPGFGGKIIVKGFPKIPVLKKLFNTHYSFMSFEAIYLKEGNESCLEVLFESVLAMNNLTSGLIWLDAQSKLIPLVDAMKKSFLHLFYKRKNAQIIAKFIHYSEDEMNDMSTRKSYISAFDLT